MIGFLIVAAGGYALWRLHKWQTPAVVPASESVLAWVASHPGDFVTATVDPSAMDQIPPELSVRIADHYKKPTSKSKAKGGKK